MKRLKIKFKVKTWLLFPALLNGCAHVAKPVDLTTAETKEVALKTYNIGVTQTSYVGEPLVRVKKYTIAERQNLLGATNDFVISGGLLDAAVNVNGKAGHQYEIVGTVGSGLHAIKIPGSHLVFGITAEGRFSGIAGSFDYLKAPIQGVNVYKIEPESTKFLPAKSQQVLDGYPYKNHELLYSGSSLNDFKLLYREYSLADLIRPAFSQELTYPISSKSIRFRGYRIEILHVNPESITYRVVEEE